MTDIEKLIDNVPEVCEHWDVENGVCTECGDVLIKRRKYEDDDM